MAVMHAQTPMEHLYLLITKAAPGKKQKFIEDFNASLGLNAEAVRDFKHTGGIVCPACGPQKRTPIVGYGRMKPGSDRRRYQCRACGLTFNDHTDSVIHRSRKADKWPVFMKAMLDGLSVRQIAQAVGISPATAHAWRHKILDHIMKNMQEPLSALTGIVEYQEYAVNVSNKGQKQPKPPAPHSKKAVIFCKSRAGGVYIGYEEQWKLEMLHIGEPRVSREEQNMLPPNRHAATRLIVEAACDAKNEDNVVNASVLWHTDAVEPACFPGHAAAVRGADKKLLHTNNVTPLMKRFASRYAAMRGVATKYLPQYALLHRFLEESGGHGTKENVLKLIRLCL